MMAWSSPAHKVGDTAATDPLALWEQLGLAPAWARVGLVLLSAVLGLLLLLLRDLRALGAKLALSDLQSQRREAEVVRAIKRSHESQPLDATTAAIEGKAPLEPSQLADAIDTLEQLVRDVKWTEAGELLERCIEVVRSAKGSAPTDELGCRLAACLAPGGSLYDVPARSSMCKAALADLNSDASWTLSSDKDGTRVQYRRTDHTLAIKVDALVDGVRPADTLYVWRETSVYKDWFPLVTASTELREVSEAESLLHMEMDAWLAYNDMAMRGWGCDCLKDGFLLMIVRPVTQADVPEDVIIPPMAQHRRLFPSQRVQAEINILVEPLSKSTVRFAYSLTIPLAPKVPLWVVNFILQQGVAGIFASMKEQARKMLAGDATSAHLRKMQTPDGKRRAAWLADRVDRYIAVLEGRA